MMRISASLTLFGCLLLTVVHGEDPSDPGSQLLRDLEAAEKPLLAEMAEKNGYGLEEDQIVRVVRPPFPEIRMRYYVAGNPSQARLIPQGPDCMTFRWKDKTLTNWGMTFGGGGYDVEDVLTSLQDLHSTEIEGDSELLRTRVAGDWIVRESAERSDFLEQMEQLLRVEFELPIRMKYEDVEREVWVASDEYKFNPLPGQPARSETQLIDRKVVSDPVQVFSGKLNTDGSGGGGMGNLAEFLGALGDTLGQQVVDSALERTEISISWRVHDDSRQDAEAVLKNITTQTGLTFGREVRTVKRLVISREK